ncbi:MAG: hypothetical protein FWE88_02675 [Phycisphaerae bacterium]|nr:hypothetical protein [Phycisphaerae bacterium]
MNEQNQPYEQDDNLNDDTMNDAALDAALRRVVGQTTPRFDADAWLAKHHDAVTSLATQTPAVRSTGVPPVSRMGVSPMQTQSVNETSLADPTTTGETPVGLTGKMPVLRNRPIWRTLMSARVTKIAASIAVVAAVAILAVVWGGGSGSTIALAQTLEQLKTKSYTFEMETRDSYTNRGAYTCMILEPGRFRMEETGGEQTTISIVDFRAKRALLLFEPAKAACPFSKEEFEEEMEKDDDFFVRFLCQSIDDLWGLQDGQETKLDPQKIDGLDAQGFRVTKQSENRTETITVWADAKTAAPLRIDIVEVSFEGQPNQYTHEVTLRNFKVIDKPDPALFSTDVPEGYAIVDERGPRPPALKTQDVIDFLCQPLPVPEGAKVLLSKDGWWDRPLLGVGQQGGDRSRRKVEKGTIVWRQRIALDVMEMTPEAIAAIPKIYRDHLVPQFHSGPGTLSGFGRGETLCKGGPDRFLLSPIDRDFWTWGYCDVTLGDDADYEVDMEVMDFAPSPPGSPQYGRKPVRNLTDPVQGQRVAYIRINLVVRNLQGEGKWPEPEKKATSAPSTQSAETSEK